MNKPFPYARTAGDVRRRRLNTEPPKLYLDKQKPSDLDATPEATEEHERLSEAYDRTSQEKNLFKSLKKQARGKEKSTLSKKIGVLELNKEVYSALYRCLSHELR
ncbi:hypothetical protein BDR22DRAFT_888342 [Usnea florida]